MKSKNLSYYLAFRYVPYNNSEWSPGVWPELPEDLEESQTEVGNAEETLEALRNSIAGIEDFEKVALFLSGGIDSAILGALLPPETRAYTIDFLSENKITEVDRATSHATHCGLDLQIISVTIDDYELYEDKLMIAKKAPLHPVEVALHKAAITAAEDGKTHVFVGNGADSTFGGMDKLLSKDWSFNDFVNRYTFIQPQKALRNFIDIESVYEPYRENDMIDFIGFLKRVHGTGIIQAFNNSVANTGVKLIEPFEELKLKGKLDIERIRNGEPKYILYEIFNTLFAGLSGPEKVPFARPMDEWLAQYSGPVHESFLPDLNINDFTGNQKYQLRCLDRFLFLLKEGRICP